MPLGKVGSDGVPAKAETVEAKITRIAYATPAPRSLLVDPRRQFRPASLGVPPTHDAGCRSRAAATLRTSAAGSST